MLVRMKEFASLLLVFLVGICLASNSHYCRTTVKNRGPLVQLDIGCTKGKITWINPVKERAISFTTRKKPFTVCFDSARAGASVYRLESNAAKTLVSSNSEPGSIECMQSDCKHVTLLLRASSRNVILEYNYTISVTNACPQCTSDCYRKCLCKSKYVFVAKVLKIRYQQHYHNYVKVRYFLRHHGNFTNQLGTTATGCSANTNSGTEKYNIPKYGILEVKSKCRLQVGKMYLFSASLSHHRRLHDPSLTMCCAQENYKHAWTLYSYLVKNHKCC